MRPCTPAFAPAYAPAYAPALALLLLPLALLGCAAAKPDNLVSAVMQQECSVLNLDRGLPYCRMVAAPPEPPPFCTRSRGSVDCWRQPPQASPPYRGLADTPAMPAVERQARPWPRLLEDPAAAAPAPAMAPVAAAPAVPTPPAPPILAAPMPSTPLPVAAAAPGTIAPSSPAPVATIQPAPESATATGQRQQPAP